MIVEFVILFVFLIAWWYRQDQKWYKGYPPGPPRFPVLGSLPILATKSPIPSIAFGDLAKKYGDVMFIRAGSLETVIFTSYDSILEMLNHEKAADRGGLKIPLVADRAMNKNLGILWGNGPSWVDIRKFTMRTLRDFGFGKEHSMDFVINEELDKFIEHTNSLIQSSPNGVLHFDGFFDLTVINVLWRLVTGVNYALDDPKMLHLLRISDEMTKSSSFAFDLSMAFPVLRNIFPTYFGRDEMRKITEELHKFAWDTIHEHRASGTYATDPKGFVDCFLQKIDETENKPGSHFNDEQLLLTILDLFQGGAETTSKTLGFAVLYMLRDQNIQERIQNEIDSIVPDRCPITLSLKPQLPYCQAALLETMRYSSVVPFPPLRAATEDFYFRGYFIRKETALMPNVQAVHFDKAIWVDPDVFRPNRFLDQDGCINHKMAEFVIPFGAGKRLCAGKSLAETNLFLYFTTLFRTYQFQKALDYEDPSIVPNVGMTNAPKPFHVKVVKRSRK